MGKSETKLECTLTDSELVVRVRQWNKKLCESPNNWGMSIPANPDQDPDLLISELCRRFEELSGRGNIPDSVKFYYMRDDHTFTQLSGDSIDEVADIASEFHLIYPYGMLCPAILFRDGKEVRRVGKPVHSHPEYPFDTTRWIRQVSSDGDVRRLMDDTDSDNPDTGRGIAEYRLTSEQLNMLPGVTWLMFGGRATGRTEVMAVATIIYCIKNPGLPVQTADHRVLENKIWYRGYKVLADRVQDILQEYMPEVEKDFVFNLSQGTVMFNPGRSNE